MAQQGTDAANLLQDLLRFAWYSYKGQGVSMLMNSASFCHPFTSAETKRKLVDAMQAYQAKYVETVGGDVTWSL